MLLIFARRTHKKIAQKFNKTRYNLNLFFLFLRRDIRSSSS
nr:MAG TPA: hypothetical protein [Caudoviricetes sp.]